MKKYLLAIGVILVFAFYVIFTNKSSVSGDSTGIAENTPGAPTSTTTGTETSTSTNTSTSTATGTGATGATGRSGG